MRILVIHQYYLAPGQAGGSRFNEFARLWREAGHDVVVVAGTVHYATGEAPPELRGSWLTHREEEGVDVWRCRVPQTSGRGYAGRMMAFAGFTLSSIPAILRAGRPDVVIATSPPLTNVLGGWIGARWHGVPWIFEVRDLWPESAITTGVLRRNAWLTGMLFRLERFAAASAARIVVLTPAFRDDMVLRGLAASEKISLVPNGADLDRFWPEPRDNALRRQHGWGDRFVALYAGAHGRANALQQLVETAELLRHRNDILIALVGDGPERSQLEADVARRRLTNIQFLGPQDKKLMPAFVNGSDAGLAVLQRNATFLTVYPNKVFDYMACARPTVLAIDGVARRLVCDEANAGLFAEPEDAPAIARAIERLVDEPALGAVLGGNGRQWVVAHASRAVLAARYLEVLTGLVKA